MNDHRYKQLLHSRMRAWEHFQLKLSDADVVSVCRMIKNGGSRRARYVCQAKGAREVWTIGFGTRHLPVIYDPHTEMIATFLPNLDRQSVAEPKTKPKKPCAAALRESPAVNSPWSGYSEA